jgi:hypothetical protein
MRDERADDRQRGRENQILKKTIALLREINKVNTPCGLGCGRRASAISTRHTRLTVLCSVCAAVPGR